MCHIYVIVYFVVFYLPPTFCRALKGGGVSCKKGGKIYGPSDKPWYPRAIGIVMCDMTHFFLLGWKMSISFVVVILESIKLV